MRKLNLTIFSLTLTVMVFTSGFKNHAISQDKTNDLPSVSIKKTDGSNVDAKTLFADGKPLVLSFWATWCKPCVNELNAISENYDNWKTETGVNVIAVSIDDARSMSRVPSFASGKGWEFEVYCDPNNDLKRALNVVNVPHTFLFSPDGKIVYQHTTYAEGDELELYEKIKALVAK